MIVLPTKRWIPYFLLVVILWLTGCKKQEETKERVPLNAFSMQVNGQMWTPIQAVHDPCISTYSGHYGTYGEMPMCTIYAYRDPRGRDDADSENLLRMRVMNVTKPGTYPLDGTYKKDFESYLMFQMQQPAGKSLKRYVNEPRRRPFMVKVDELIPIKFSPTKGFKGSFSGILYNEADPADSLIIENGKFTFAIVNYPNHCGF